MDKSYNQAAFEMRWMVFQQQSGVYHFDDNAQPLATRKGWHRWRGAIRQRAS